MLTFIACACACTPEPPVQEAAIATPERTDVVANVKLAYWDEQRRGANGDGGVIINSGTSADAWFKAASEAKIEFVRLSPIDWVTDSRDFLIGDADAFVKLSQQDVEQLISVLDIAHKYDVKIVVTMFSLPGLRSVQTNNNKRDYRMWTDEVYQKQAFVFWAHLAKSLKNHPAIVAYNPLNEPHPARNFGYDGPVSGEKKLEFEAWKAQNSDKSTDVNRFNRRMVRAIRSVDRFTPIILDGWFFSSVQGLQYLESVDDEAILYAFHYYGPWVYATYRVNKGRFRYPDKMPTVNATRDKDETEVWTAENIVSDLAPVAVWAREHNIPFNRIIAEEFGVDRRVPGATAFLSDTVNYIEDQRWHWAFYSFRSGNWDGMDFELGTKKLHYTYWDKVENGHLHEDIITRQDTEIWRVLKDKLEQ